MRRTRIKNAHLAAALAASGKTARQVAAEINRHPNTVSRILNFREDPTPATVTRLAIALDTTPDALGLVTAAVPA